MAAPPMSSAPAGQARGHCGHRALHAASAGSDIEHRVSRTSTSSPSRMRCRRASHLGTAPGRAAAPGPAARGRRQRPAGRGAAGLRGNRPRCREPLRHHAGHDRQRALQRFVSASSRPSSPRPTSIAWSSKCCPSSDGVNALDSIYVTAPSGAQPPLGRRARRCPHRCARRSRSRCPRWRA